MTAAQKSEFHSASRGPADCHRCSIVGSTLKRFATTGRQTKIKHFSSQFHSILYEINYEIKMSGRQIHRSFSIFGE
jgi:hypothetical protein